MRLLAGLLESPCIPLGGLGDDAVGGTRRESQKLVLYFVLGIVFRDFFRLAFFPRFPAFPLFADFFFFFPFPTVPFGLSWQCGNVGTCNAATLARAKSSCNAVTLARAKLSSSCRVVTWFCKSRKACGLQPCPSSVKGVGDGDVACLGAC